MLFEKYLQKILGLNLALYEAPDERGWDAAVQKFKKTQSPEWFKGLPKDKQDAIQPLLDDLEWLQEKLEKAKNGKEHLKKYVENLWRIYKIWDPTDPEFAEIIKDLQIHKEELWKVVTEEESTKQDIKSIQDKIAATVKGLEKENKDAIAKKYLPQVLWVAKMEDIKQGTTLTIDRKKSDKNQEKFNEVFYSLWKLIPQEVGSIKVTVGGKEQEYKRIGGSLKGEFRDMTTGKILKIEEVDGKTDAKVTVWTTRDANDMKKLSEQIDVGLEGKTDIQREIIKKAKERGLNEDALIGLAWSKLEEADDLPEEENEKRRTPEWRDAILENIILENLWERAFHKIDESLPPKQKEEIIARQMPLLMRSAPTGAMKSLVDNGTSPFVKKILEFIWKIFWINLVGATGEQAAQYGDRVFWERGMTLWGLNNIFEEDGKKPENVDISKGTYGTYGLSWDNLKKFVGKYTKLFNIPENWKGKEDEFFKTEDFKKLWLEAVGTDKKKEEFKNLENEFIKETLTQKIGGEGMQKFSIVTQNALLSTIRKEGLESASFEKVKELLAKYKKQEDGKYDIKAEKEILEQLYASRGDKNKDKEKETVLSQLATFDLDVSGIRSVSATKSASGTTECSKTARLNAARNFWITIPQWDAKDIFANYFWGGNGSTTPPGNATFMEIFTNSTSSAGWWQMHKHRAVAFKKWAEWFVLDPYLPAGRGNTHTLGPIPLAQYESAIARFRTPRRILWVMGYSPDGKRLS